MKKLKILSIAIIMALLVTGCSSSGGSSNDSSNKKVEMETTTISKPIVDGTLSTNIAYPKGEYTVVKEDGATGEMGYFDISKGDTVIASLYLSDILSTSIYKDDDSLINLKEGVKEDKNYVTFERGSGDDVNYNYALDVAEGNHISITCDSKDELQSIIDDFVFSEK